MPVIRDHGRVLGVVYTPPEVAGPMVERALEPLVRGKSAAEILDLRVCDPAIGPGAFLLEVVRVLAEHVIAAWERGDGDAPQARASWSDEARARVIGRCIHGVDVDARAVAEAREALDADDRALRVANALELDWARAFPEVFARGGFDVVVGNPPYIRQERLVDKSSLRAFASFDGVADLYVYFIELAHRVLRPGGRYCLIVPTKWLTVAYGARLRGFLAEAGSVEGVVDLSRAPLFAGADAFPCIVWGTVGRAPRGAIEAARPAGAMTVATALAAPGIAHARERWTAAPWHIDSHEDRALIDRLEQRWPALGEVVAERPSRGVVTGCNRAFVIDRATRDRLLADEPAAAPLIRPFVKGRDVRSWVAADGERWILLVDRGTSLDQLPVLRAHLARFREALEPRPAAWQGAWTGRKPGSYAWYELQDPVVPLAKTRAPRLLYQDIQTSPACCLDERGDLVPDTTVWILPTADRFVLAVLNSPLYGWYARRRFPPALNGAVRPKLAYLRALPIAAPSPDARRAIEQLVEQRLAHARDREPAADLDHAIARAVAEVYELSSAERALIT